MSAMSCAPPAAGSDGKVRAGASGARDTPKIASLHDSCELGTRMALTGGHVRSLLALLALGLAGCSSDDLLAIDLSCSGDSDCLIGSCLSGQCISTQPASWIHDVEIRTPPSSRFVSTQRAGVSIPSTLPWNLVLPEPVIYETTAFDGTGARIDADVKLVPEDGLTDRPLSLTYRTKVEEPALIPLPAGAYAVRIAPLDASLPSADSEGFTVIGEGGTGLKELRLPERYRRVSGKVRNVGNLTYGIDDVTVSAVGTLTRLRSTTTLSDALGNYELVLPESEDTAFLLTAVQPESRQPAWQFRQVIRVPEDGDREKIIDLDLPSPQVQGVLQLTVRGAGGDPVSGARVSLTSSTAALVEGRSHVLTGTTRADGAVVRDAGSEELPVLRGYYAVEIVPPARAQWARFTGMLDLSGVGNRGRVTLDLSLARRTEVSGEILDAAGRPVQGALVSFEPIDVGPRFQESETDSTGWFSIALDPGNYVMEVLPSTGELPRHARQIAVVGTEDLVLDPTIVPPGFWVDAKVVGSDGSPIPQTDVEVLRDIAGVRHVVSRGTSDDAGDLRLLLPP